MATALVELKQVLTRAKLACWVCLPPTYLAGKTKQVDTILEKGKSKGLVSHRFEDTLLFGPPAQVRSMHRLLKTRGNKQHNELSDRWHRAMGKALGYDPADIHDYIDAGYGKKR